MSAAPTLHPLPLATWPALDRKLWQTASEGAYFAALTPAYLQVVVNGYGRWLSLLAQDSSLDSETHPADRVTLVGVQTYLAALGAAGKKRSTIVAYLCYLRAALQIMVPERSHTWLHARKLFRATVGAELLMEDDQGELRGWPVGDRRLWQAGLQVDDILMGPQYAAKLRAATVETVAAGYRRWLTFLWEEERLDTNAQPADRITRANVAGYLRALRRSQCNTSILARISELRTALQIMQPDADFRW